jgi:hypothetical protein
LLVHSFAVIATGSSTYAACPIFRLDAATLRTVFIVMINVALFGLLFRNRVIGGTWNGHGTTSLEGA